ncbi:MAG: FG-GAP-like repeat-containing protein, partial [Thermoanaerobaculia bacterium]|nr:FG-GAP-like repeat-containing protein [Thermoanaerobaculia bacterium]
MARCLALLLTLAAAASGGLAAPSPEALRLRQEGLAHLENERPVEAEASYRQLVGVLPGDPLGHANLAIALLRQQRFEEAEAAIGEALELAPGRADLLAARASLLVWSGRRDEALPALREASAADPDDLESLYALYRHASAMRGPEAETAAADALARLRELRPENLFVLLRAGQQAVAVGDRATASEIYLRVRELTWQVPGPSEATLEALLEALEENDLEAAVRPSRVLENLFKGTPLFAASLGEIFTNIQGIPIRRFVDEELGADFGDPVPVHFRAQRLDAAPSVGGAVTAADLDDDGLWDVARIAGTDAPGLEIRLAADGHAATRVGPAPQLGALRALDLDNDGSLELVGWGGGFAVWDRDEAGAWIRREGVLPTPASDFAALAAFDYDMEGDLDLAVATADGLDLLRNTLEGPLESVGARALPAFDPPVSALLATDLDRDGDLDLVAAGGGGVRFLDNLRQGRFGDRTAEVLGATPAARAVASGDLDNDGRPELVLAGDGVQVLRQGGEGFRPAAIGGDLPARAELDAVRLFDADNDGRLDLAL